MIFRKLSHGRSRRIAFITGLSVGLASILGAGFLSIGIASAASDCAPVNNEDDNAIIYCGFSSPSTFISKVRSNTNNTGDGHVEHDLQAIYAYYGLEPADYNNFVSYGEQGTAYSNGQVIVGGQVVATNVKSIGRQKDAQGAGVFTQPIAGTNYYGNAVG